MSSSDTPFPAPWYAIVASSNRSQTTALPAWRAGAITRSTWSARAARRSSVSVSADIGCSRIAPRSRSARSVPPGSRVTTTCRPPPPRWSATCCTWLDFPAPSTPSRVANTAESLISSSFLSPSQLILVHGAVVLADRPREMARAVATRHIVERIGLFGSHRGAERRESRHCDGRGREPRARVGVVRAVLEEVHLLQVAVERASQAVDHGRIHLQAHADAQPVGEHARDDGALFLAPRLLLDDGRHDERLVRRPVRH